MLSFFLPGFYYVTILRKYGFWEDVSLLHLLWGAIVSLCEIVITMLVYHVLMNKNRRKL